MKNLYINVLPAGLERTVFNDHLHGLRLALARAVWVLLVGLALGLFIRGLPARFTELVNLSLQARHTIQSLPPTEQRALRFLDRSLDLYAGGILALEIAIPVVFSLTGVARVCLMSFGASADRRKNWKTT